MMEFTFESSPWEQALENLRHPAVRDFAHNNVTKGDRTFENFALLVTNYIPEDAMLLESLLRDLISQKDWDDIHAAGMVLLLGFMAVVMFKDIFVIFKGYNISVRKE